MITGYVSSDEEDDFDFGYSEPMVRRKVAPPLPIIQTKEVRDELTSALENSKKISLFLKAVDIGDLGALKELISLGVDIDSSGSQEWTPLMKACGIGKFEVVQLLLEYGSNPNLDKELFTPLMACCTYNFVEENLKLSCVRLLLEHGADVNMKDKYKTTALMYAIGSGYLEIVEELLAVPSIDVNIQDKEGWTAIFFAVNYNHLEVVKKLVSSKSILSLKDRYGRTTLSIALDKNLKEIAEILGYTEETNDTFDTYTDRDPVHEFLRELPSKNGQGGFSSDTQSILALFNQIEVKVVGLPEFLNMTDNDLNKIGVKLQHDRKKILANGIHQYHLCPWKKSSMHQVLQGRPLSLENAVAITGDLIKHLTIANASLRYLDIRISSRKKTEALDLSLEMELINTLVTICTSVGRLKIVLRKILKHGEQMQPVFSADYIQHCEKVKGKKLLKKYSWFGVGMAVVYLIYYFKFH